LLVEPMSGGPEGRGPCWRTGDAGSDSSARNRPDVSRAALLSANRRNHVVMLRADRHDAETTVESAFSLRDKACTDWSARMRSDQVVMADARCLNEVITLM